ncbi:PAS domain-containing methyl-accepting chemotaxis protein [Hyphomicrobium sp.]|uniref:methyl-accepting chemotaxis protein n=1 Tax=Hyphomicrobium sp. TaxID=82 RepID=UPI0025C4515C|nr:PAS domain-containing methyl-accepting chemotaxis protein [Hyphomicrobium sp.]MCC7252361.1 PAS domain-containing methyl-accepting chemotaxis protein [Hyphomicrobium sp.]
MFFFSTRQRCSDRAVLEALHRSQAIIEFEPDGTICTANKNFLDALGYTLDEIKDRKHRMFLSDEYANSSAYKIFWDNLVGGESQVGEFGRIGKNGKEVWIEASYNPVFDNSGKVMRIIKIASDVTAKKLTNADATGQLAAISKSQAVIEFEMDGTIRTANGNFLKALGYELTEIQGRHHQIFAEPAYAASIEYQTFWNALRTGTYQSGQFKRIGKSGRAVWIEASYNPIMNMAGKPFKVVKYATDITAQVELIEKVRSLIGVNIGSIDNAMKEVDERTTNAASAAHEASSNVQSVASGTEEMTASIQEIARSMTQSLDAVQLAREDTDTANQSAQRLIEAARAMTDIIEIIQAIANQINLLALNATIESARAGEAGKGFAVVASEVKSLARQVAEASEQITDEIRRMQEVSSGVVDALERIKDRIESVQSHVGGTASAVEEQTAVTHEISSNMQQAAIAVGQISEAVTGILEAGRVASEAVASTRGAAETLAK